MKAIILAAGLGTRLGKLTKKYHKSLLSINDESIIERQNKILKSLKIDEIIIVTGHNQNILVNELSKYNVNFIYNQNYNITSTTESHYVIKDFLDDEIVMLCGDVIFEQEIIEDVLKQNNSNDISLLIDTSKIIKDDILVNIERENIVNIGKNIPNNKSNATWIGISKFSMNGSKIFKRSIEEVVEEGFLGGEITDVFRHIINKKNIIHAKNFNEKIWYNVNTKEELEKARDFFRIKN